MAKCKTCSHCEYLHEYEAYFCNAAQQPIRDDCIDEEDDCGCYEEYLEEETR